MRFFAYNHMEKKYNFVYQTKNLINGKTYIGVHATNKLEDNYIGCGIYRQSDAIREVERDKISNFKTSFKSAVVKHGYSNFKREILTFFDTEDEAYEEEEYLVDEFWIKKTDNYNISLGGRGGYMAKGKLNHKYISDIYIINKITGEIEGVFPTAQSIKDSIGLNQARISSTLRGKGGGLKHLFFTRNPEKWREELSQFYVESLDRKRNNGISKKITAYNLDGTLYKTFPSKMEACRYLGKSKHGVCYLDDVVDKYREDGSPLRAWGYFWKYGENEISDFKSYDKEPNIHQIHIESGEHIGSYINIVEASKSTGLWSARIAGILRGIYSHTNGYYFTRDLNNWEKELQAFKDSKPPKTKPSSCVEVSAYDLEGNFIQSFPSIRDAARFANIEKYKSTTIDILRAINQTTKTGRPRTACGYVWKK